ncbi:hypothetical protein TRFO_41557 [Tritrichomonas foetus]|uniref:Uncharacterized protein n=1 Tax=Tritrichomonas foetus TaxID=1144522 RepID=A0A1J4KZV1_9EUKA|nr:hypothetical protein TRFO_41557 [Tritrichomonas foetus]|eukprot:OHT16785.1 hypothetical protein TRFO_41557 [Tritrichomonas foetus]
MSVEQLKAQLEEAKEKYRQIVAATQAQSEKVKEIEQRNKVLNSMVDKAQQSKTALLAEIKRMADDEQRKAKAMKDEADSKSTKIKEEIKRISKSVSEKEQLSKVLKLRYQLLQDRWEQQEQEYQRRIDELDQTYLTIRAKTNEVILRIQAMQPRKRTNFMFRSFPDFRHTSLFAPTAAELEADLPFFNSLDMLDTLSFDLDKPRRDFDDSAMKQILKQKKIKLEKLKKECRLLQHTRDEMLRAKREKDNPKANGAELPNQD